MAGMLVVGVDGSRESKVALRFALEEARLRDARLVCVHAWSYPIVAAAGGLAPVSGELLETLAEDAQTLLDDTIAEAGGAEAGVEIEKLVVEEAPVQALVAAAEGADLLVVGSRGHGGFAGLLLGSVSQQCAHHAPCPVVIVPPPREG